MRFRIATNAELDRSGQSHPSECGICVTSVHVCGGCGVDLEHHQGSTCSACWSMIFSSYGPEEEEDE